MASKTHLVMDQSATFSTDLTMTDDNGDMLDLQGFTANAVMRKWYTSSNSIVFNTHINVQSGVVTLELDSSQTANIAAGRYVYDVNLTETSTNSVSRVVEGIITVTPSVSGKYYTAANSIFTNNHPLT